MANTLITKWLRTTGLYGHCSHRFPIIILIREIVLKMVRFETVKTLVYSIGRKYIVRSY